MFKASLLTRLWDARGLDGGQNGAVGLALSFQTTCMWPWTEAASLDALETNLPPGPT